MIYYTKENEVLDYICWKNYCQSGLLYALLVQEAEYFDPGRRITGIFDIENVSGRPDEQLGRIVNQVLEANHGLTEYGVFLPAGLAIHMPEIQDAGAMEDIVQLWD